MSTIANETTPLHADWVHGTLVGFDLETTGTDPTTARIVTAALIYQVADGTAGPQSRTWLVDPGVAIPEAATAVHGVSTEHARAHGVPAAQAVSEIRTALDEVWQAGLPLVVFNACYDLTLMHAASLRHGVPPMTQSAGWARARILDPLVIDRGVDRYRRGKRTLGAAATHYGVTATDAHSADGDALAACHVMRAIARTHRDVAGADLDALHAMQQEWHRQWAVHFQAYLRSRGRAEATIDPSWPLQSA